MTASQMEISEEGMSFTLPDGRVFNIPKPDYTLRTDCWLDVFDGTYRFFFPVDMICELERKCGYVDKDGNQRATSIFQLYGALAKGRYEIDGRSVGFAAEGDASPQHCLEVIRLGLVGGGIAIVDGAEVSVSASRAKELIEIYLKHGPKEDVWNLAYVLVHTIIHGRKQRPEEVGTKSMTAVPPAAPDDKVEA